MLACVLSSCAAPKKAIETPIDSPIPDLIQQTTAAPLKPFIPPQSLPRTSTIHEVAPLETLWRISKMYDVTQQEIMHANSLSDPNALKVGQKLVIPAAAPLKSFIPLYPNTRWKFIVVHHTASDIGNARLVNLWHKKRGWEGIGYHFIIDNGTVGKGDGQIEISPRWIKQMKGAHCKACDMNEVAIGVSLVGNFSKTLPSAPQMDSLVFLIRELMKYYHIPAQNVIGHRNVLGANTECPGTKFPWEKFKKQISY
ncbi:MAG: N-acetylmuramoyl-L-alanine amidase [Candidatus Omnitrophica bacterium]|nr:N-acetylmuramoyl-L-alanine amidase [Candidatus Omnitrophota bacterium]